MKKTIIIISLIFRIFHLSAENTSYLYKNYSITEGLTDPSVTSMLEDKYGNYWIGTISGLNKITDGDIRRYSHNPNISNTIPHNKIVQISEDAQGDIWIQTQRGCAKYNMHNDSFDKIEIEEMPINLSCITQDYTIFSTDKGIYSYDLKNQQSNMIIDSDSGMNYHTIKALNSENILIQNWETNKILRLNLSTQTATPLIFDSGANTNIHIIRSMLKDSNGDFWISSAANGIYRYSIQGDSITLIQKYNKNNSSLSENIVLDIAEHQNQLWIATDGGGINIIDLDSGKFSELESSDKPRITTSLQASQKLYIDSKGIILIGTVRNGVVFVKKVKAKTYRFNNTHLGIDNQTITSLHETDDNIIWIGTDGGGLSCFNRKTGKFKYYNSTKGLKINSIVSLNAEELLLSIYGEGLKAFCRKKETLRPIIFVNKTRNEELKKNPKKLVLEKISEKEILIMGELRYKYSLQTSAFMHIQESLRTASKYLGIIKKRNSTIYNFLENDIYEIKDDKLSSIFQAEREIIAATTDRDDNIWYSDAEGLNMLSLTTSTLNKVLSLPHSVEINDIIYDNNNIWLGTRMGIYSYDIINNTTHYLGKADGVSPNKYQCSLVSRDNSIIYFGGSEGLSVIDKSAARSTTKNDSVSISQLFVDNKPIEINNTIEVAWDFSSIDISIDINNRDIFNNNTITYLIESKKNTTEIETRKSKLTINSLLVGCYTVKTSFIGVDGQNCPPINLLNITVTPPWWSTWWMYIIWALILCTIIVLVFTTIYFNKRQKWVHRISENKQNLLDDKIRFLINISHELRTPLTLAYSPIKQLVKLKPETVTNKILKNVLRQLENMFHLVNLGLDARKTEIGGGELNLEEEDLNPWIESICTEFDGEYQAKNILIEQNYDQNIEQLYFDKARCRIILSNILMNALKYSNNGSTVEVKSKLLAENRSVRISVIDQGIGLQENETDKLFGRFYQGHTNNSGYGIGLNYAKNLVEKHGGKIGAYNNKNGGATFFFELPSTLRHDIIPLPPSSLEETVYIITPQDIDKQDNTNIKQITNQASILFVDDDEEIQELLHSSYSSHFKNIHLANDGEQALDIIKKEKPDIIVSDIMMPKMDGYTLCRKIKTDIDISHIPVILLTTRGDSDSTIFGYKVGADSYIPKPFDTDFLFTIVFNQLRNRINIQKRFQNINSDISTQDTTFSHVDELFMEKLNAYITTNISNEKLDLKALTSHMNMGRTCFINKIKSLTGASTTTYINRMRIDKAKELIETSNHAVAEISYMVGFSSATYFSSVFKNYTNQSPSDYKLQK